MLEGTPPLTTHDRNILKDIVEILTPFQEATDFVQVSCVPSAGYIVPCVKGLQYHMDKISTKYHSSFVLALKESLLKRMPYYEENETYILASILDPRFKLRWCQSDGDKLRYIAMLKDAASKYLSSTSISIIESTTDLQPPSKKKKEEKLLFNFMEGVEEMNDESSGVEEIIDKYLAASCLPMDSDPSKFWKDNEKEYLALAQMAKDILSMPASSAPVERLFSIAGRVFTPLRCSLKDDRFQQLMFIRCNNSFNA